MALLETNFTSDILHLSLAANIILPDRADAWDEPPAVLYLLHGLSDDHTIWSRRTSIERYAANYPLVVVMPNVHKSFYCDMAHGSNYWKFVSEELPMLVKRWFNVSNDWKKTYVAGLSMGGYGAMKLALGCPGQYAAAASLSGALDLAAHIDNNGDVFRSRTVEAVFGDVKTIPDSGNDLIAQLGKIRNVPDTDFYLRVGTEDYLYQDSITFRDKAALAGLRLTYEESAGSHEWGFWDAAIQRVLEWLPITRIEEEQQMEKQHIDSKRSKD
ncbi:MAG: esterase family protein [Kiritimatiellales bacterium]|nr:esterase family protein [Kiritimatiellales bacterium]MCF7863691.1 esterase family protein [Kiritimatiellales bacterium]